MASFEYKLLTPEGSLTSGSLEAGSRGDAIKELQGKGTLLDLVEKDVEEKSSGIKFPVLEFNKIRPQQLTFLFRQLGELVDAGMPLVSAIDSLQKFCGNQKTRTMLENVARRIRSGENFSQALEAQTGVFSRIQLAMVKVGERSGKLSEVLHRIADLMEAQMELRGKIKSALSYPFFILLFSSVLCWGLVNFLLPQFEPIWTGAKLDMTQYPVTQMLLKISAITRSPVDEFFLVLFLVLLILGFWRMTNTGQGRDMLGDLVLRIPVLGNFLLLSSTAEASSTISMLLNSGMNMTEVLDLAAETASNPVIGSAFQQVARSVREGNPLSKSIDDTNVFPELFVQMVSVGESSSDLPGLLDRVSQYYKRQLDDSLKSLTALIEPVTMVFIGGIVFVFVLGVFLPIMGIVGALSNQAG
ncbi:MAG: type II secretion system F family protein [Vulcanimicrobiota bacterium]